MILRYFKRRILQKELRHMLDMAVTRRKRYEDACQRGSKLEMGKTYQALKDARHACLRIEQQIKLQKSRGT